MFRKNFNVMIPGLQVELKKIKPFIENLKGYRNIYTSKFPLKDIQINMAQIKNQPLLA